MGFPYGRIKFQQWNGAFLFFVQNLDFLYTVSSESVWQVGRIFFGTWRDRKVAIRNLGSVQRFRSAFLFGLRLGCEGVKLLSEAHRETEKMSDWQ